MKNKDKPPGVKKSPGQKSAARTQWHAPFCSAMKIELEAYGGIIEFIDEKVLTKKPLLIDLLIIKKQPGAMVDSSIADIFRTWNIFEYKSPSDYVSIDDFYRVCAYAYLLKADSDTVDGIKFDELTISFVSDAIGRKLTRHLTDERRYSHTLHALGIHHFRKDGEIPLQFIDVKALGPEYEWLGVLTDKISIDRLQRVINYDPAEKNGHKEAVLDAIVKANQDTLTKFTEVKNMGYREILKEITYDIIQEEAQKIKEQSIENVNNLHGYLLDNNMLDELRRSVSDHGYQQELLMRYCADGLVGVES